MSLSLVVDVGTTNIKSGLIGPQGEVVTHASENLALDKHERGAAEHDPDKLFQSLVSIVRQTVDGYEDEIEIMGLTGYQFGFLPLDENKNPLTGIITLMDERSKSVMPEFQKREDLEDIYRSTGCPPLFSYLLPKLLWLREEKPDIYEKSRYFGDVKSFLMDRLVGEFVTDPGIASSSQLFNINKLDWDDGLLEMVGVSRRQLPEVRSGEEIIGEIVPEIADKLNLPAGIKIISGVYDGGAMVLGLGGIDGGVGVCNLGTTAMLRTCSSDPILDDPQKRRLQTYSLMPGKWAIGGAINNAGLGLRWLKNILDSGANYDEIIRAASEVGPGSGGLFALPYLTGERDPRIGNMASGSFFGLKEYHDRRHLIRAVLEGVSYSLNFVKEAMTENEITFNKIRIGGAGTRTDLWPRIISDVTNLPVQKTLTEDTTLIGEAMIAYKALGVYDSLGEAAEEMVTLGEVFEPVSENVVKYRKDFDFFKKLINEFSKLYSLHDREFTRKT
ncbi:MAG: gluconokinase [Candidatus Bipolaricaulia bacterium]